MSDQSLHLQEQKFKEKKKKQQLLPYKCMLAAHNKTDVPERERGDLGYGKKAKSEVAHGPGAKTSLNMRKTACKNVNGRIASATLRGFLLKSAESLLADQERPQCTRSQQQHAQHDARLSPRLLLRIQLADLP
jgi:hypothetical protein